MGFAGLEAQAAVAGLPDPQVPTGGDQVGKVGGLVVGVRYAGGDVDDRLGGEARHGRGADMFDQQKPRAGRPTEQT